MRARPRTSINFGKLAVTSYRVIRYQKRLWVAGLLAGLVPLGGWNCNVTMGAIPPQGYALMDELPAIVSDHAGAIAIGAAVMLLLVTWCRGAVIGAIGRLATGEPVDTGDIIASGNRSFWRLLPLYPLICLAAITAILLAIGMMAMNLPSALSLILVLVIIVFLAAFLIFLTMLHELASRAAVIERRWPLAALARGARLLSANRVDTLVLFAHSFFLSVAAIIIILTLFLLISLPAFGGWVYALRSDLALPQLLLAAALSAPAVVFFFIMLALYNTYFLSYWTLAYMEISGQPLALKTQKP